MRMVCGGIYRSNFSHGARPKIFFQFVLAFQAIFSELALFSIFPKFDSFRSFCPLAIGNSSSIFRHAIFLKKRMLRTFTLIHFSFLFVLFHSFLPFYFICKFSEQQIHFFRVNKLRRKIWHFFDGIKFFELRKEKVQKFIDKKK
jgi:hypothetical protein